MASYESDAHGRRHRSVEIGVGAFHEAIVDEPMDGVAYEEAFERGILEEMGRGVNIPDVPDHRHHDSVRQAERDMDISLLVSLGAVSVGVAGVYIWKKHRNKE